MPHAVILDAVRTPIGRYGGVLGSVRPDDLAAHVVRAAVEPPRHLARTARRASMRELGFAHEKLNVNGGAIALGHPLGCSGARLLGTLAYELRRRGGRNGVATMCIGVGQGLAAVVENPQA